MTHIAELLVLLVLQSPGLKVVEMEPLWKPLRREALELVSVERLGLEVEDRSGRAEKDRVLQILDHARGRRGV